ncbi:MAG: hypothetical protein DID91_2727702619 [Candidatus Nitrotoga sp. MKT]|nr:MAG: hypothetical protein DID91_2727702619 [Candidatus Nitrotoga sp. MKT]
MALFNCKTKLNELIQLRAKFMCNIHDGKLNAIGIGSNESDICHLKCMDRLCFNRHDLFVNSKCDHKLDSYDIGVKHGR